jgi:hypothetical protein
LIIFQRHNNFINLSRADPRDMCYKMTVSARSNSYIHAYGSPLPAICLSVVGVDESFLTEPRPVQNGKHVKFLTASFHALEYERWVAVLCLIYKRPFIRSQLVENRMTFSTRTGEYSEFIVLYLYVHFLDNISFLERALQSLSSDTGSGLFANFASPSSRSYKSHASSLDVNDIGNLLLLARSLSYLFYVLKSLYTMPLERNHLQFQRICIVSVMFCPSFQVNLLRVPWS